MRATYFGAYDFNSDGVGVLETIAPRKFASGLLEIPGASGALDRYGSGASPKPPTQITVRFQVRQTGSLNVDQQLAAFSAVANTGQQWLKFLLADGTTIYRSLAKCIDCQPTFSRRTQVALPLTAVFELAEPYFYADTQTTDTFTVSATPTAIDLNNTGTAPLVKAILRFTGTAKSPKFLNNTNGFLIQHSGDITSAIWEVDIGKQAITLAGADDYVNCHANFPTTQIGMFKWDRGVNDVDFIAAGGGTPSGNVQIIYRLMYE